MGLNKWAIWEGIEVEGRLQGIKTLFFYCLPYIFSFNDLRDLAARYAHLYFCNPWVKEQGCDFILQVMEHNYVTLEVYPSDLPNLPRAILLNCHLVLRIDTSLDFSQLKASDEVRLTGQEFNTWGLSLGQLYHTQPTMYNDDIPLYFSEKGQHRGT